VSHRRFLVEGGPVRGEALLDPDTSKHVAKVLRLRAGEPVTLFDGRGTEWAGTLLSVDRRGVRVAAGEGRPAPRPAGPRVVLATAVPKGKRMSVLLAMATEAGVDAIVPVAFERSSVRGVRPSKVEHWRRTVLGAVRQCGRAFLPVLEAETGLPEFLARPRAAGERRFLASTRGRPEGLARLLAGGPHPTTVVLVIGPEGGITEREEEAAVLQGFEPCCLGDGILRVETAGVCGVATVRCQTRSRGGFVPGDTGRSSEEE
jgi:16S rRNA (uracil1498-N3)-methyltransferase